MNDLKIGDTIKCSDMLDVLDAIKNLASAGVIVDYVGDCKIEVSEIVDIGPKPNKCGNCEYLSNIHGYTGYRCTNPNKGQGGWTLTKYKSSKACNLFKEKNYEEA